ncbi:MAG: hypothetical protein R3F22_10310 [Lysobacteraceae bacterium]
MNAAYRQLRELLPVDVDAPATRFPTDARRIKAWVDALPRANQQAVLRDLDVAVASINAQRCDASQRFAAMELLRPVALESIQLLVDSLSGASFPLTDAQGRVARQAHQLHAHFLTGYLRVVVDHCAPDGNVPFLRGGQVATALQRAIHHGSRRLFLGYWLYLSPAEGIWRQLHSLYGFAEASKLAGKSVDDAAVRGATSPGHAYAHAVLLSLSNPYRFSQREQDLLGNLCADMARQCGVHDSDGDGERFPLSVGADVMPNQNTDDDDSGNRWFDLGKVATAIDHALGDIRDGDVMIRLAHGGTLVASADLLRRLRSGWVPAAERGHQRLQAGHRLDTVLGLSALHYQLADGQGFDGFMQGLRGVRLGNNERAAWTHGEHVGTQVSEATVLDQSLGGYRLSWDAGRQIRARVGELIGLSVRGGGDLHGWMVGVIRWLRYDPDGGMYAGVELLARRAQPLGVRVLDGQGAARPAQRGIRLQPVRPLENGDWTLLVPSVIDPNARLEIAQNSTADDYEESSPALSRVRASAILEHAGDYLLLAAQPVAEDALA